MAELRSLLSFMDADDRVRVLRYYDGLFDDAGAEGEDALIEKLGSPVRQVLRIEKQYREILDREEAQAYSPSAPVAPEPELFPADPEPAPSPDQDEEEDLFQPLPAETAPQAPAERLPVWEQPVEQPETRPVEQPEMQPAAAYAGVAISAATFARPEEPLPPADDEDDEDEDYDEDDYEPDRRRAPVSGGRVVGAVFVTIPMAAFVLLGIALSLAVALLALAPGVALGAAGGYLWGYVFGGVMSYLPDMLLMGGILLLCFAFSLLLLWLGIWLAVGGAKLTVRITASVYRAILRGGDSDHE